jgi:predicted site-specific integrase-resolvase
MKESPTSKKTSANPAAPLLVDAETLATRYGIAEKTVRKWGQDGTLPYVKISRRCCRYPLEACDDIILRRRVRAISES